MEASWTLSIFDVWMDVRIQSPDAVDPERRRPIERSRMLNPSCIHVKRKPAILQSPSVRHVKSHEVFAYRIKDTFTALRRSEANSKALIASGKVNCALKIGSTLTLPLISA